MSRNSIYIAATAVGLAILPSAGFGQTSHDVTLHVNPRWKECSFQINPALTQNAWHQFAQEAGLVTYFRPLNDAKPMGAGRWELSLLQWDTGIDDTDAAWNDTFVHPDSVHWLHDGHGLKFPGFMLRTGITKSLDAGAYFTKNPNANYGFYGGQLQYNVVGGPQRGWNLSTRASLVSIFGPDDLTFTVYGLDVIASKEFSAKWVSVSPYVGASTYLTTAHEKTAAVTLADENVVGTQAMVGVSARISAVRIGMEYNTARVASRSLKIGVGF